jgi:hypothetical protein
MLTDHNHATPSFCCVYVTPFHSAIAHSFMCFASIYSRAHLTHYRTPHCSERKISEKLSANIKANGAAVQVAVQWMAQAKAVKTVGSITLAFVNHYLHLLSP